MVKSIVLLRKIRQKTKYLKSFNQVKITLGMYESFRTARTTEREIVPLLALLVLFNSL